MIPLPRRFIAASVALGFALGCSPKAKTPAPTTAPASTPASAPQPKPTPPPTELVWDKWGVPHVFANSEEDALYAYGWSQMRAHGALILKLYAKARARAAEYWGKKWLPNDQQVLTFGVPRRAKAWLDAQTPAERRAITAFVAGMNAYADQHPDAWGEEKRRALPIVDTDPLAHTQMALHFTFMTFSAFGAVQSWSQAGSNAYAIAPKRSASGRSMLLLNPHLLWKGAFLFFEAHLSYPNVNLYGAGLVGTPFIGLGFNEHMGWTHTVNTFDGSDLYELTLKDDGYVLDGQTVPFDVETSSIRVRQDDGRFTTTEHTVRRSKHGPVMSKKDGKALALRITALDRPHLTQQYLALGAARNLGEFKAAMSQLQMPMFNAIYADRHGDIYYLYNGVVPKRAKGDVKFWRGIVDGTSSELIWNDYLPFEALPQYTNPSSGFVQNANDPPWTSTYPPMLKAQDYPAYLAPQFMTPRSRHSTEQIMTDAPITFDQLVAFQQSNRLEAVDEALDELIAAARKSRSATARAAAKVLREWDKEADADSKGAVLFAEWFRIADQAAGKKGLYKKKWSPKAPLTPPSGLRSKRAAVSALIKAAKKVKKAYGALDVPWGDVYRVRYAGKDLPASVAPGNVGSFRVGWFQPDKDGRNALIGGNSFVAAVEFGDTPKARGILTYGNTTDPTSPFYGNQLELFSKGELREIYFTRAALEANAVQREQLRRLGHYQD